ncbi:MAG: GatB/YqeY domain-containing protein [Spirochaetota bacterium]
MTLLETIETDMRAALRGNDELKKTTLRGMKADLMTEKAKTGKDLTEEQMLEIAGRCAKRRKESIAEFRKAGRDDLADKEASELVIIEAYLPKQMTEAEVTGHVRAKLAAVGSVSQKDFGRVMGEIMKELKGKTDGGVVRAALTRELEGK